MEQSEREKAEFLKLCGEQDRKKVLGEVEITGEDVERLSRIMEVLGMYAYEVDFIMEHMSIAQAEDMWAEDAVAGKTEPVKTPEELRDQLDGWLREFYGKE